MKIEDCIKEKNRGVKMNYTSSNKRVIDIQEGFISEGRNGKFHVRYNPSNRLEKYGIDPVR